jgi:iron complex outermembrane receptor protein
MAHRSMRAAWARLGFGASLIALTTAFAASGAANAQQTAAPQAPSPQAPAPQADETRGEVIVVTGFRGSLAAAIETKREETGITDSITAEDIADFPDLNLAESLQRVPGVQIDRDGGEGRTINVRGLSSDFVRVRLNGMEALATTGGRDGRQNRNRAFDFNVFASELFNSIKVSKSQSAETEEGSLGATVDLTTARPFDYTDFTMAAGLQGSYNDLARNIDPRATFLISDRWFDGKLGALFSVAYTKRNTIEEGSSSGRFRIPTADGCTTTPPNTGTAAGANRCYQTIAGPITTPTGTLTGVAAAQAANNAAHPRIPRYGRISYDRERIGSTFTTQFQPFESTTFTYDLLYADLKETRHEEFLEAISFAREANASGLRSTDLLTGRIDDNATLVEGLFNDVDIRVEQRRDNLETEFFQNAFRVEHEFSDRLRGEFLAGHTRAVQYNPNQTTLSFERYDVDGYSYNYSDPNLPAFNYGFDVTNPGNFLFSASTTLGDPSLIRLRPNKAINTFENFDGHLEYDVNDWLTIKGGASQKTFSFRGYEERRANPEPLPASVLTAFAAQGITIDQYSTGIGGFGRGMDLPTGTPTTWVIPSIDKLLGIIDFECDCVNSFGDFRVDAVNNLGENRSAEEQATGAFIQADFDTDIAGARVRANVGVRYVETELSATGFTNLGAGFVPLTVTNTYDDTLPSMNVSIEPTDGFIVRVAASKVLARPTLPALTPGGTVDTSPPTFSINAGNPFLEPIRANTYDLSIEWYPYDEALFAIAFFAKDIESFVQRLRILMPYNESGFPDSLLPAGVSNTELFDVNSFVNTPGGDLTGFEISAQTPFTFLPAPFNNFGGQLSYTEIQSQIAYVANTNLNAVTPFIKNSITGQSPKSLAATIYYENGPFEARVSGTYRDEYLTLVPAASGNDVEGKAETFNVDFSASYELSDNFALMFEAINLPDQYDERWINSVRKNSLNYEHTGREFVIGARYKY